MIVSVSPAKTNVHRAAHDPRWLIRRLVPLAVLDWALLAIPGLQAARLVNYETTLDHAKVEALLRRLRDASRLDGDIVECGSARGGSAVIMALALRKDGCAKTIFACDSFEGFNRQELASERRAGLADAPDRAYTATSLAYVTRKLRRLGVSDVVKPVPGYFEDTLPALDHRYCLAFIDCDLGKSVAFCARELWPRIVPGGHMIIDDYDDKAWGGVEPAVRAFVSDNEAAIAEHGEEHGMYFVEKTAV
jgi:predicted O-methyltransferase YrrM